MVASGSFITPKCYNTIQCNAMQCNAMQCNAMQCNAMQCNAIQYNTIEYKFYIIDHYLNFKLYNDFLQHSKCRAQVKIL